MISMFQCLLDCVCEFWKKMLEKFYNTQILITCLESYEVIPWMIQKDSSSCEVNKSW